MRQPQRLTLPRSDYSTPNWRPNSLSPAAVAWRVCDLLSYKSHFSLSRFNNHPLPIRCSCLKSVSLNRRQLWRNGIVIFGTHLIIINMQRSRNGSPRSLVCYCCAPADKRTAVGGKQRASRPLRSTLKQTESSKGNNNKTCSALDFIYSTLKNS